MFGIYLRRELRRRARQSSIIAIGLALGIGLVITVTALSAGVKNAQSTVLHSLYGLDTDITVSQTPTARTRPWSAMAWVIRPAGLVKFSSVACGACRCSSSQ